MLGLLEYCAKINGPDYIPLPEEHILRLDIDYVYSTSSNRIEAVIGLTGRSVVYANKMGYINCQCLKENWPEEYEKPSMSDVPLTPILWELCHKYGKLKIEKYFEIYKEASMVLPSDWIR